MIKFFGLITLCCLLASIAAEDAGGKGPSHGKLVLCKMALEDFIQPKTLDSKKLDLNLCTHLIIHGFVVQGGDTDKNIDAELEKIKSLQKDFPHLKIHAGVSFEQVMKDFIATGNDSDSQKSYIKLIRNVVTDRQLNGIDMFCGDLQKCAGETPNFEKIADLLERVQRKFHKEEPSLIISMSVSTTKKFLTSSTLTGLKSISEYVDLINWLPEYNVPDSITEGKIETAMEALDIRNDKEKIKLIVDAGISSEKLIMGFHAGGPLFDEKEATQIDLKYISICGRSANNDKWEKEYENETSLAKLINSDLWHKQTILFVNSRSIVNRLRFAMKQNMTGASIDSILADDVKGSCDLDSDTYADLDPTKVQIPKRDDKTYPLLRTINEAIPVALEEISKGGDNNGNGNGDNGNGGDNGGKGGSNEIKSQSANLFYALAVAMLAFMLN